MSNNEIFAVFFSLLCVILTVRRSVWCWAVGIVGVAFYAHVFYCEQLYADMGLQAVYLVQGVYGWLLWIKNGVETDDSKRITIEKISGKKITEHLLIAFVLWIITTLLLGKYTNSSLPDIDALLSVLSLVANYYLAKRFIENWFIWIVADLGYILLFAYKGLYLSAGLYGIFFCIAIYGLLEWKKILNTKTAS